MRRSPRKIVGALSMYLFSLGWTLWSNEAPSDVNTLLYGSTHPRWKMSHFAIRMTFLCAKNKAGYYLRPVAPSAADGASLTTVSNIWLRWNPGSNPGWPPWMTIHRVGDLSAASYRRFVVFFGQPDFVASSSESAILELAGRWQRFWQWVELRSSKNLI